MERVDDIRRELNEYLFFEFGCDLEQPSSEIGERFPFLLEHVGEVEHDREVHFVFTFEDDQPYFAVAGRSLNFYPCAGMSLDNLRSQIVGSAWVGEREPVDLDTSVIGNPEVPSALERQQTVAKLAESRVGPGAKVMEGLFLVGTREYLALVEVADGTARLVGSSFPTCRVGFPAASTWRRVAVTVGEAIRFRDQP